MPLISLQRQVRFNLPMLDVLKTEFCNFKRKSTTGEIFEARAPYFKSKQHSPLHSRLEYKIISVLFLIRHTKWINRMKKALQLIIIEEIYKEWKEETKKNHRCPATEAPQEQELEEVEEQEKEQIQWMPTSN